MTPLEESLLAIASTALDTSAQATGTAHQQMHATRSLAASLLVIAMVQRAQLERAIARESKLDGLIDTVRQYCSLPGMTIVTPDASDFRYGDKKEGA